MAVTGTDTRDLAAARGAVAVLRFALETCREVGREGHDLPRAGIDAAETWLREPTRDNGKHAVALWGELCAFEPTRPDAMPGADDTTRAATVALVRGARLACAASGIESPKPWIARAILGNAVHAIRACGLTPMDAWREIMERFTASCPEVEL